MSRRGERRAEGSGCGCATRDAEEAIGCANGEEATESEGEGSESANGGEGIGNPWCLGCVTGQIRSRGGFWFFCFNFLRVCVTRWHTLRRDIVQFV